MNSTVRISIRIPFCFYDCSFCPHSAISGQMPGTKEAYMSALIREIIASAPDCEGQTVDSIHITGGIIASVNGKELDLLLKTLHSVFRLSPDCQTVLNAYPGTVNIPTVHGAMKYHVTAIDCEEFTADDRDRVKAGLTDLSENLDLTHYVYLNTGFGGSATTLMYGMPGQTEISFRKSLARVMSNEPLYISLIPCGDASPITPNGEDFRKIAEEHLSGQGYKPYAEGRWSHGGAAPLRCFLPEEKSIDYIGFGLGARSVLDGVRCRNTQILSEYIAHSDDPAAIVHIEG